MTFLDRLERRFGHLAIPGLVRYVMILNILVYLLAIANPGFLSLLTADRAAIWNGEIWRLVSWIFIPSVGPGLFSPLFMIFYVYFTWWIGDMLEANWGSFRLTLYYLLGMLGYVAVALVFGGSSASISLNFTLFLALATIAPNLEILVFFVFPVKIKWLAIWGLLGLAYLFFFGPVSMQVATTWSLMNYLLFFAPEIFRRMKSDRVNSQRRAKFDQAVKSAPEYMHHCEVCGANEASNPHEDFRVAADGREYCFRHLPK